MNEALNHPQLGAEEQSWEQRFRNLQQELSRVKEVVKGWAPDTMDTLVQQTESPFTAEVLHFPLQAKFRMPQVETFDGVKDPVDHLNTYKNQMELHGYQDPVRCRAFATTLKGPAFAWFNRIPPSSISSFRELSIAFVSHFIRARTYRKPSYHLFTVKQGSQESLKSYVQRFNAESLKIDIPDEKFLNHCVHCRVRSTIKGPDVFHLEESSSKHGRGTRQSREIYKRRGGPHIKERELLHH